MNWRVVFVIIKKDLVEAVRNANIFVSVLLPFLIWAIFNFLSDSINAPPGFEQQLFILFAIMSLGMAGCFVMPALLIEEREKRTFQYLITTPASILDVLVAKVLVSLVFAGLIITTLALLEGVQIGNNPAALFLFLLGALFMVVVGLLIGSLFSSMQQVNTWAMLVIFLLIAPSWFTSINPEVGDNIFFRLLPTYYLMRGLHSALSGDPMIEIAIDLIILCASVLMAFLLAIWLLEKKRQTNSI